MFLKQNKMSTFLKFGINIILLDENGEIIYREILNESNKNKIQIKTYLEEKLKMKIDTDRLIIKKYVGFFG